MTEQRRVTDSESWNRWQEHVLDELRQLRRLHEDLDLHQRDMEIKFAKLETKVNIFAGGIGFVAGIIGSIVSKIKLGG